MSRVDRSREKPRAMIHRRILDVAASEPKASLSAIADEVSGASPNLVDRVLDEYGDPAGEPDTDVQDESDGEGDTTDQEESGDEDDANEQDDQPMDTTNATESGTEQTSPDGGTATRNASSDDSPTHSLSEKQRRTLRALYERPEASQGDLADELDVTRATVSRRLNAIPGFEWSDRRAFAESVFGDDGAGSETASPTETATESATEPDDGPATPDGTGGPASDPESTGAKPDATNGTRAIAEPEAVDRTALGEVESTLAALEDRLASIESQVTGDVDGVDESAEADESDGATAALSPELTHKVAHACMESDRLTEDEELAVLRALMQSEE